MRHGLLSPFRTRFRKLRMCHTSYTAVNKMFHYNTDRLCMSSASANRVLPARQSEWDISTAPHRETLGIKACYNLHSYNKNASQDGRSAVFWNILMSARFKGAVWPTLLGISTALHTTNISQCSLANGQRSYHDLVSRDTPAHLEKQYSP